MGFQSEILVRDHGVRIIRSLSNGSVLVHVGKLHSFSGVKGAWEGVVGLSTDFCIA